MDIKQDEEELKRHKEWITLAEAKHKKEVIDVAAKFKKFLKNDLPAQTEDNYQSKLNFYHIIQKKIIPMLMPKEIKFKVETEGGMDQIGTPDGQVFDNRRAAIILNKKLEEVFNKAKIKYQIRQCLYDLSLANTATMLVSQHTEVQESPVVTPEMSGLLDAKAQNGEAIQGETPIPEQKVTGVVPGTLIIKRESYKLIKHDYDSVDFFYEDARFTIRKVLLPWYEAKKRFPDLMQNEKDVTYERDEYVGELRFEKDGKEIKEDRKVAIYEIYDYSQNPIMLYRYWGKGKKLIDKSETDGPLVSAKINYIPDETYPPSDMTFYESSVDEVNFYGTVTMNNASRSVARKIFYSTNALEPDSIDKLNSDKDMEAIPVNTHGQSLSNSYAVFQPNAVDPLITNQMDRKRQDINEAANISNPRMAQSKKGTATEAQISDQAFQSNVNDMTEIVKDFIINIAYKVVEVLKVISTETETFTLEHPNGQKEQIQWSNKDIKDAKLVIDIDIDAALPNDIKLGKLKDFLALITQPGIQSSLQSEGKKIQMFELIKSMARYYMPADNFDRIIVDDQGALDPDTENLILMTGDPQAIQSVQSKPNEDFQKHIKAHSIALKHPLVAGNAQIQQAIQAHLQQTQQVMSEQEQLKKPQQERPQQLGAPSA